MPLLEELTLRNLLSFGSETGPFPLGPLNVLVGPNGSGKSNVIEAIGLLRAAPADLEVPIREGGGIRDWIWRGSARPAMGTLEAVVGYEPKVRGPITFKRRLLRWRLEITDSPEGWSVADERLETLGDSVPIVHFDLGEAVVRAEGQEFLIHEEEPSRRRTSVLAQLKDPVRYPEITYLGESLSRIRIYRDWSFGRFTPPRLPQPADLPNNFLLEDGSNLGLVLNRFRREPHVKARLIERLRLLYEGVEDYEVIVEGGTVQVFLQEGRWTLPATRLSDGTLRYLALLAILCHPTPPPLICIEEPELGLHPDVLHQLAELLVEASHRTQLIVTTHSDILVDALTETPEAIVVCEKHEGATTLRRLDREELGPWLEKYRLGELWTRGDLGGTRW